LVLHIFVYTQNRPEFGSENQAINISQCLSKLFSVHFSCHDFVPTTSCHDLLLILHIGHLCPDRLSHQYLGSPPVFPATPPPLSPSPSILAQPAPGAFKPAPLPVPMAPHTTGRLSTRFSSPPQDSVAPDESSNSPFTNGVDRSSANGEGYSGAEQTQDRADYDDHDNGEYSYRRLPSSPDKTNRSDRSIKPVATEGPLNSGPEFSTQDARAGNDQGRRQHNHPQQPDPHGSAPAGPVSVQHQHRPYDCDPRRNFVNQQGHGSGSHFINEQGRYSAYYPVPNQGP
jgi:hypothetical protein